MQSINFVVVDQKVEYWFHQKYRKRFHPSLAHGCVSSRMLLCIICVLLCQRKLNREAEITPYPDPFSWTTAGPACTLTGVFAVALSAGCTRAEPRGSQGPLPTSFCCFALHKEGERSRDTWSSVQSTRVLQHPLWLRTCSCPTLAAVDLPVWAQCGQEGVLSFPCSGRQTPASRTEFYCVNCICGGLNLITTKCFLRLVIKLFIEQHTSYHQWLHFCLMPRSKCSSVWLVCSGQGGSL